MHGHRWFRLAVLAALGLTLFPQTSEAESPDDILIITNKGARANDISLDEVKKIFLRKKTSWSNGDRIIVVNAKNNAAVRDRFRQKVLGMTAADEQTYWANEKVRRQISPPPELSTIPKAVFKLKNSIGYAFRKDVPANVVKVLLVIPH